MFATNDDSREEDQRSASLGDDAVSASNDEAHAPTTAPAKETPVPAKSSPKPLEQQGKKRPRAAEGDLLSLLKERREQSDEREAKKVKIQCESQERIEIARMNFEKEREQRQFEYTKSLIEMFTKKQN